MVMVVEIAVMAEVTVFSSRTLQQQYHVNSCMSLKLFSVHMHLLSTSEPFTHHREQKTPIYKANNIFHKSANITALLWISVIRMN